MKYLSVCSGIEAATMAWHGLGWEPVGFSEIESFPCQLLAERFPTVPNFGDMTKYREWPIERGTVDLLVGGTPCQAFSVAGLRKGLEDPRGNLALTFVGMVDWYRPEWVVWENVPGVLSSNGGRDFGAFLGALGQLGYGFAYRVLDAQYFGVPQRRRRVFVVAHSSGDPRRAGAVLFEPESLRGDTPTRKRTGKDAPAHAGASPETGIWKTVGSLTASGRGVERTGESRGQDPVIAVHAGTSPAPGNGVVRVAVANAQAKAEISQDGKCPSLTCIHEAPYVLYENHANDSRVTQEDSTCQTVSAFWGTGGNNTPLVQQAYRKSRRAQSTDDFETWVDDGVANTVNCFDQGDIRTTHAVAMVNMQGSKSNAVAQADGPSYTLNAMHGHDVHAVAVQQPMAFSPQGGGDMRGVHPRPTAQPQRCQIEDVIQPIYSFKPGQSEAAGGTFVTDGYAPTLQAINNGSTAVPAVVFAQNQSGEVRTSGGVMGTLNTNANASVRSTPMIQQSMAVRRLTPVECERLQGFPDGWTDIRPKGKDTPDSPRYKALGNSMAVPVMRWIGERIQSVR